MREFILALLIISSCFILPVSAEEVDPLEEAGLTLVALRNDSLDVDQDGITDSIRIVIVLNSTNSWVDLTLTLFGEHAGRVVSDEITMSFDMQANASITYDSWAEGEHMLTLEITDVEGRLLSQIAIGSFDLTPALSIPSIDLRLSGSEIMETGDDCQIERRFTDETGPRYGMDGTRSISGTPFKVLDDQNFLDCSDWPAGEYIIRETYQNGLGQTSMDELEIVIVNKPPPAFELAVSGNGVAVGGPCSIDHVPAPGEDHLAYTKTWTITPQSGLESNTSRVDCKDWSPGVYKVLLTVTNFEGIKATEGVMLVRLPPPVVEDIPQDDSLPLQSRGDDTQTSAVGWYGIGLLSIFLGIAVFVLMSRNSEDEDILMSTHLDSEGNPDSEGLPTHVDDEGILWRRHEDGRVDWWDSSMMMWSRWQ